MARQSAVFLALLLLHTTGVAALALDPNFPLTPDPAFCAAPALAVPEIHRMLATPVATPATPLDRLPAGTPVGETLALEIERVLIELFACFNAGEPLRAYMLYSDTYLRQIMSTMDVGALSDLATPSPLAPDEWTRVLDLRDIRLLSDGRVAVTAILDPALIPVDKMFVFILIEQNGEWLVDDVLDELEFSLP